MEGKTEVLLSFQDPETLIPPSPGTGVLKEHLSWVIGVCRGWRWGEAEFLSHFPYFPATTPTPGERTVKGKREDTTTSQSGLNPTLVTCLMKGLKFKKNSLRARVRKPQFCRCFAAEGRKSAIVSKKLRAVCTPCETHS